MAKGNSIASANVLITASADGLNDGLSKAGKDVQKWGKEAGGKGGGGMMSGLIGGLGKAGPYAAAAAVGIGAVALAGKEVIDTLDELAKQGDIAQAIGLTAEQFTGIAGVAKSVGEDSREFIESLVTMGKLGTDAAAGTKEASAALQGLGIDADKFIKLRADEQFFQVFDQLSKVQDPLQRTRFLMQAFGEDGGKFLLPLLKKTPEELRKMAAGFAVSTEEMKKSQAASEAVKRVNQGFGKIWRGIAVGLAPVVEAVANFAEKAIAAAQPFIDWFGRYWGQIRDIAIPFFEMVGDAASQLWRDIKEGASDAFGWVPELPTIQEVVVAVFRATGIAAALAWDTVKSGAGAIAFVVGAIVEQGGSVLSVFREIVDLAKNLPDELRPDWVNGMIAGIDKADDKIKAFGGKAKDWGEKAMKGWGNSAIDFNNWLDKTLNKAKAVNAAVNKPGAGPDTEIKSDPIKLGGALAKGSAEAYSMIIRNKYGIGSDDTAKKQLKAQEGIKANGDKANGLLGGIKDAFANIGSV